MPPSAFVHQEIYAPPLQTALAADPLCKYPYPSLLGVSFLEHSKGKCLVRLIAMFVFGCRVWYCGVYGDVLQLVSTWWRASVVVLLALLLGIVPSDIAVV